MSKKAAQKDAQSPPVWEWILAGVGAVLIATAMGTALYRVASTEDPPVAFEIEVVSTTRTASGFAVDFRVKNTGSKSAAAVNIEGKLTKNGEDVETSNATVTYVPADSEREGGLFFTNDPQVHQMQIRATGYEKP